MPKCKQHTIKVFCFYHYFFFETVKDMNIHPMLSMSANGKNVFL